MRMMMKAQIPTEAGNEAIRSGRLPDALAQVLERVRAEAAYFTTENGRRTALIFFEMDDSSGMPAAAEPLFMGLGAEITFAPVMNADEMRTGVARAAAARGSGG